MKDKILEYFALLGQIITFFCCFASIINVIPHITVFLARLKAKEITEENIMLYAEEVKTLSSKIKKNEDKLVNMYYTVCDEVENELSTLKEEVKYHLTNRNYETIINNHIKYENVLPLIENEGYYKILRVLIELGKRGIDINVLSNSEKRYLDNLDYIASNLDNLYKNQKQETFGEKQRRIDEEYLDFTKPKTFKKKR